MSTDREGNTASNPSAAAPELQLIYDAAPVGLAFLTPDCRYLQVNQRLTEICGISVADHIGRSVRETVPQVADQVEAIVHALTQTGRPITDVEVRGQRSDGSNAEHTWRTSWYPLYGKDGTLIGISVVAEDTTERKRAEAALSAREQALQESEARFQRARRQHEPVRLDRRRDRMAQLVQSPLVQTTAGQLLRRWRAGAGKSFTIRIISIGSFVECRKASRAACPGTTPFRFVVGTARIAGF